MKKLPKNLEILIKELTNQGYENICFFQPGFAVMGAAFCEIQLAEYLASNSDLNIFFCSLLPTGAVTMLSHLTALNGPHGKVRLKIFGNLLALLYT